MSAVFKLAMKDIKLLLRDRLGAFFIIGFPVLMGLFFGIIMGGPSSGGGRAKMKLAVVDQDQSEISKKFIENLAGNASVMIESDQLESARQSVRKGNRVGMILLPDGFGETAGIFWETPPKIQVGMDPSRTAESAMVQGFVMEAIGGLVGDRFSNPAQFRPFVADSLAAVEDADDLGFMEKQALKTLFGSFDKMLGSIEELQTDQDGVGEAAGSPMQIQFADIESLDITKEIDPQSVKGQTQGKLTSKYDISFPQAMMWGVLACCAGFAISIAQENSRGTMVRLMASPLTRSKILSGKALACFLTVLGVIAMMTLLGLALGMRPKSFVKLTMASMCVAFCFVGIMMTMSVLGKTEQSVNGIGWAINMVMAMIGGGMIPVMFMPGFMQQLSVVSPVKWSILSVEGAIWRDFTYAEMLLPCGVLIAVGIAGMFVGSLILNRRTV